MSLSKIFKSSELADLQEFEFRSFGDAGPGGPPVPTDATFQNIQPQESSSAQVDEAFSRGRQDGLQAGGARLDSAAQALAQGLEDVSQLRRNLAQNSTQDMLRMVMAIAERIIRRKVEFYSSIIVSIIENALQASVRADSYHVRIHPDDLEAVSQQKPLFMASVSGLQNVTFEADSSITAGGCRVESELGDVDATIESQLDSIRKALVEAIVESG